MSEPVWLTADEAIVLNAWLVEQTGERHLVRDPGLLDGALHRPQAAHHYERQENPAYLAALLMFAVGQNHPFEQGKKRTGFYAGVAFLGRNGLNLALPDSESFAEAFVAVLAGRGSIEAFAREHLAPHISPVAADP